MARRINYIVKKKGLHENDFIKNASTIAIHSLLLSHSIRRDTVLNIIWLEKNISIKIHGGSVRNIRPDQESTMGTIKKLLEQSLGKKRKNVQKLPCIIASDNITVEDGIGETIFFPVIRDKGFNIIDELNYDSNLCSEKIPFPGIENPVEAIILLNMVLDLCSIRIF